MIAKFADHLPLYRQESIFGGAGLAIPRSTLAQREEATGVQLQPLVDALRDVVLSHLVVHADRNTGVDARARYEENPTILCLDLRHQPVLRNSRCSL